jgi:hypothetical protein
MKQRHIPATFKCYLNYENVDNLHYKMVIHVRKDSVFRRYQKQMRYDCEVNFVLPSFIAVPFLFAFLDLLFVIRFNGSCIFLEKIKGYGHYTGVRWTM